MKLYCSLASPFARKVRIAAIEKNIPLELVMVDVAKNPPELHSANPVGKIPTLITESGEALPESHYICTYLEMLQPSPALFPQGKAMLPVLRRDALAVGIMEASVRYVIESRRPENIRSQLWLDRQVDAITRTLDVLEAEIDGVLRDFTIDQVTLVTALDYVNFRLPQVAWQKSHERLAAWHQSVQERRSVRETMPVAV